MLTSVAAFFLCWIIATLHMSRLAPTYCMDSITTFRLWKKARIKRLLVLFAAFSAGWLFLSDILILFLFITALTASYIATSAAQYSQEI